MTDPVPEVEEDLDRVAQEEADEAAAWAEQETESAPEEDPDEIAQEEAEEAAAWSAREAERLREIHATAKKVASQSGPLVRAVLSSRLGAYTTSRVHRVGEVADLVFANDERCLLKIAIAPSDTDLLESEARVLTELHSKTDEKSKFFRKYLPTLLDSFPLITPESAAPRGVNVLDVAEDHVSLADIRTAYPNGIEVLDAVWMLRRTFEVLGWVHAQGYVHGAVVPEHVLVHPVTHGARLVDWVYAVRSGHAMTAISGQHRGMYFPAILRRGQATPSLDVSMAAQTALMLMSDKNGMQSPDLPASLRTFLGACSMGHIADGWAAYREYDQILKSLYGPRRYRKFAMPV